MRRIVAPLIAPLLLAAAVLTAACDVPPRFVDTKDIDMALARGSVATICKGLEMKDPDTRRYAAEKLEDLFDEQGEEKAAACICDNIADERDGWDAAIAEGIKGTTHDEIAGCFAELVKKPDLPQRTEAVVALAGIPAPAAREALAAIAADRSADGEVRARALAAIGHDPARKDLLIDILAHDPDATARLAAAEGLTGMKDDAAIAALRKAFESDEDGAVRGQALIGLKRAGAPDADELVCKAMMEDPSAEVRARAVLAYKGTKRKEAIACLRRRALTYEESPTVRDELLTVLKSSPSKDAAKVLCDAIPFWMKSYVIEDIPDKVPGTGIIKAQNDRDWENSYACLQKAYRKVRGGGYSCFARMYVAWWFRQVGGQAFVPKCPGYEGKAAG